MQTLENTATALRRRGYEVRICTPDEARSLALDAVRSAANVGWGGSETLKELGIREAVLQLGKEIRDHRTDCELFLLSANALLTDGRIVNVDGTGNRIAASVYGPRRVMYFIGRNKLVEGGIDEAIARIRREACPKNARRLGRQTPCALTGRCGDCDSDGRMCKVTVIFDRPPTHTPTTVLLIDADLGY